MIQRKYKKALSQPIKYVCIVESHLHYLNFLHILHYVIYVDYNKHSTKQKILNYSQLSLRMKTESSIHRFISLSYLLITTLLINQSFQKSKNFSGIISLDETRFFVTILTSQFTGNIKCVTVLTLYQKIKSHIHILLNNYQTYSVANKLKRAFI